MNHCFTYLGLQLTKKLKHLIRFNFTESVEKLRANIKSWRILPLYMIGQANVIKMVEPSQVSTSSKKKPCPPVSMHPF